MIQRIKYKGYKINIKLIFRTVINSVKIYNQNWIIFIQVKFNLLKNKSQRIEIIAYKFTIKLNNLLRRINKN